MNLRLPFIFVFCSISFALCAQVPFSVSYYHDTNTVGEVKLTDIKFDRLDKGHPLKELENKGYYLFKVIIHQPVPPTGIILNMLNEHLDTITLYKKQGDKLVFAGYGGNNFYAIHTHLGPPSFWLRGNDTEYYIKVAFKKNVILPIQLYTISGYNRYNLFLLFELGMYHGTVVIIFLINFFLFLVFKDRRFIYYNGFLFFLALSFLYSNSHFPIFTQSPFWLNNSDLLLHLGITVTAALFAISFLEIEDVYPWAKWATSVFMVLIVLAFIINLYHNNLYVFFAGEIVMLLNLFMYWTISIIRIRQHLFSKYFALAYGILLFFMANYYLFRQLGFGLDLFTGQLEIANIAEMLILSVALSFNVSRLKMDNQRYRAEIDRYVREQMSLDSHPAKEDITTRAENVYTDVKVKYNLTERETEVLRGISEGLTNHEIGEKLFLSVNTIKFHTRKIFEKLEINNRAQAASRFHQSS